MILLLQSLNIYTRDKAVLSREPCLVPLKERVHWTLLLNTIRVLMIVRISKAYIHLLHELLTSENPDNGLVLSIVGELALWVRIQQHSPILLDDLVFILPKDGDTYSWQDGFVVRALEKQVYVQTRLGFIWHKRERVCRQLWKQILNAIPQRSLFWQVNVPITHRDPPLREGCKLSIAIMQWQQN